MFSFTPWLAATDRLFGCRTHPELFGRDEVVGGVYVTAHTRPGPGQFHRAGIPMAAGRIGPEPWIDRAPEGEQRRGTAAMAVGDETSAVLSRLCQRLLQLEASQRGQITLQHSHIRHPSDHGGTRREKGVVQRIGVGLGRRIG